MRGAQDKRFLTHPNTSTSAVETSVTQLLRHLRTKPTQLRSSHELSTLYYAAHHPSHRCLTLIMTRVRTLLLRKKWECQLNQCHHQSRILSGAPIALRTWEWHPSKCHHKNKIPSDALTALNAPSVPAHNSLMWLMGDNLSVVTHTNKST
jgi:hypothetical protein